jgi:hypothetical protein
MFCDAYGGPGPLGVHEARAPRRAGPAAGNPGSLVSTRWICPGCGAALRVYARRGEAAPPPPRPPCGTCGTPMVAADALRRPPAPTFQARVRPTALASPFAA